MMHLHEFCLNHGIVTPAAEVISCRKTRSLSIKPPLVVARAPRTRRLKIACAAVVLLVTFALASLITVTVHKTFSARSHTPPTRRAIPAIPSCANCPSSQFVARADLA
ncbi:MAG: hypothetical protein WA418_35830, partial [Bradyrhizobium sp.]